MKLYYLKKEFRSTLNMEDITDVNYKHAKKVWEDFEIKSVSKYHNLYIRKDPVLLK